MLQISCIRLFELDHVGHCQPVWNHLDVSAMSGFDCNATATPIFPTPHKDAVQGLFTTTLRNPES